MGQRLDASLRRIKNQYWEGTYPKCQILALTWNIRSFKLLPPKKVTGIHQPKVFSQPAILLLINALVFCFPYDLKGCDGLETGHLG